VTALQRANLAALVDALLGLAIYEA